MARTKAGRPTAKTPRSATRVALTKFKPPSCGEFLDGLEGPGPGWALDDRERVIGARLKDKAKVRFADPR